MHRFFVDDISSGTLGPDDARHASRVLRLSAGEAIELTDGQGHLYQAVLEPNVKGTVPFRITVSQQLPRPAQQVWLGIAPTKNMDRMEWMVEKAVEVGVDAIYFMRCTTSERKEINMDRVRRIAVSALKQSQQVWLPELHDMRPFQEVIKLAADEKFIACIAEPPPVHLVKASQKSGVSLVLVGPEGDFSEAETTAAIASGCKPVSLGGNRLRTETAGLAAVMALQFGRSVR